MKIRAWIIAMTISMSSLLWWSYNLNNALSQLRRQELISKYLCNEQEAKSEAQTLIQAQLLDKALNKYDQQYKDIVKEIATSRDHEDKLAAYEKSLEYELSIITPQSGK